MNKIIKSNPYKVSTFILVCIVFVQLVIIVLLFSNNNMLLPQEESPPKPPSELSINLSSPEMTPTIAPTSKKYPLDKSFPLSIRNPKEQELGYIEFLIKEYEFTNQVIINNRYNALLKENKELLVLHIELTNDTNHGLEILSGDHVRLTIGDDDKFIAPDINSDPVEIRPKSTVETSLGFTLDSGIESLSIHLGELDGDGKNYHIEIVGFELD